MNNSGKITVLCAVALCAAITGCLIGCSDDKSGETVTSGSTEIVPVVTIPPIPETGIPDIDGGEVIYTDESLKVEVAPDGTSFVNGQPVSPEDAQVIISQAQTTTPKATTTTVKAPAKTTVATKAPDVTTTVTAPVVSKEETTRPTGTITDTGNVFYLGKYVSTGNTSLSITDIDVYSSSKPGVSGLDKFASGDNIFVNVLCSPDARFGTILYIVHEDVEHKSFYSSEEYILKAEGSLAIKSSDNQIFFDIELPDSIPSGVYELRFVCGSEEGYIPFHMG